MGRLAAFRAIAERHFPISSMLLGSAKMIIRAASAILPGNDLPFAGAMNATVKIWMPSALTAAQVERTWLSIAGINRFAVRHQHDIALKRVVTVLSISLFSLELLLSAP